MHVKSHGIARAAVTLMRFLLLLSMTAVCLLGVLWAQNPKDLGRSNSWSSVTETQLLVTAHRTKTSVSYGDAGSRKVETESLERRGADGHYEPYFDVEKETIRVDSDTVRTVERSYAWDSVGQRRQLVQVIEGQTRTLADGVVKTVRTTSNPYAEYGNLQAAQQEVEVKKQISADVQETTTSFFALQMGRLSELRRTEERDTRRGHSIEFQKTDLVRDGNGGWQTREVRQGVAKEDGSKEENVLCPDSEGKMSVVQRTTSKQSTAAGGGTQVITETYSLDRPGWSRDGKMHLVERVTTISRLGQDGQQSTQATVENPNPGSPTDGLQVTGQSLDVVVRGADGIAHEARTVRGDDGSGNMRVVRVDKGTSNKPKQ